LVCELIDERAPKLLCDRDALRRRATIGILDRDRVGTGGKTTERSARSKVHAVFRKRVGRSSPEPATVTLPVELPKQATLVCELIDEPSTEAGCVIVTGWVVVQPLASLTVIV